MNATDEVRVENQNYYQGRNYALQSKTTGKKISFAPEHNLPTKGKKKTKTKNKKQKYWNKQHLEVKVVWSTYPFLHY